MKVLGKKRRIGWFLPFLRYSTSESGMIVGLFYRRPFIKILFYHCTISISRFLIITHFPRNFFRNLSKIFSEFSRKIPTSPPIPLTHTPYHPPPPISHTPEHTQNFKLNFLKNTKIIELYVFYLTPSFINKYDS